MGEKSGDARSFWMELEDDGKVDFIFEKVQNVLQSLKQKIKDGSATNKEYIQAMILVNDATISKNSTLKKHHIFMTQSEQENKSSAFPSTSYEDCFPKDCTFLTLENKKLLSLADKVVEYREKKSPVNLSCRSHDCSGACLMKMPSTIKAENPLQLPITCHFQRRHAKTNSQSSALHVSYKAPCGRSLRNMEEVFRYLLETNCNFLFTDNFSFNTFVQLTRNYQKQQEIVSDVDISNGVELMPVSFCNEINSRRLPPFNYRKTVWPRAYYLNNFSNMFTDSCDCSEGCIDITKCACLQLTAKNAKTSHLSSDEITTGYKYKRLQRKIPTGIYECSLLCKCNRQTCQNRVVQHGLQVRLQVFKTEKKGWGVHCLDDIDKGTFICIYSGKLLMNKANLEKPNATNENRKEGNIIQSIFSKKRKIEVAYSDCEAEVSPLELETHPKSAETENCPPKFTNNLKGPMMEMNCENISRKQCRSVIRSPKFKTAIFQQNEKEMELISLDSDTSREHNGFLNCKAKRKQKESSSDQVGDSEDSQLYESDVVDIIKCREETLPGNRFHPATTFDNEDNEVQIKMPQEEKSPAHQKQQAFVDELLSETKNTSSTSTVKSSKGIVFLLDATKEGNVGRFLNHSCCPNLLVQNVFIGTHDKNLPLMAFFTNRYVKARTELTWDYDYKAGTVPNKEILCQCGANKCRKKIL